MASNQLGKPRMTLTKISATLIGILGLTITIFGILGQTDVLDLESDSSWLAIVFGTSIIGASMLGFVVAFDVESHLHGPTQRLRMLPATIVSSLVATVGIIFLILGGLSLAGEMSIAHNTALMFVLGGVLFLLVSMLGFAVSTGAEMHEHIHGD